jgi:hypothetical protein
MRAAESNDRDQISEAIAELTEHQDKFVPSKRAELDRHPDYIGIHTGVTFLSVGLLFGKIPHGTALFGINPTLQHVLATGMGASAMFGLLGISLALKDNRLSYLLGISASLGIMLAMGTYETIILLHSDIIGVMGGALAFTITGARLWMVPRFWREVGNLDKLRVKIARKLPRGPA